jgi:hypothetical protein
MRPSPLALVAVIVVGVAVVVGVGSQYPQASATPSLNPNPALVAQSSSSPDAITTSHSTPSLAPSVGFIGTPVPIVGASPFHSATPDPFGSPTGMAWEVVVPALGDNRRIYRPVAWPGGFAALEAVEQNADTIWFSADGLNWTSTALNVPFRVSPGALQAFGGRLLLVDAHSHGSPIGESITLWWSRDGRHWDRGGSIDIAAETPEYVARGSLRVLGNRLAVVSYIGPNTCCGARPGRGVIPARSSAAGARDELGMWVWTSDDGVDWVKQRMRGLGVDSLDVITSDQGGIAGIRVGTDGAFFVRSTDGIQWATLGPLPADVDPYALGALVGTPDGHVFAADTAEARDEPYDGHTRLTVWRVSADGVFTEVFEQRDWEVHWLLATGNSVVGIGYDYDPTSDASRRPLALVSTDSERTFTLSAGWPALEDLGCIGQVAMSDRTILVTRNECGIENPPELILAKLPQP